MTFNKTTPSQPSFPQGGMKPVETVAVKTTPSLPSPPQGGLKPAKAGAGQILSLPLQQRGEAMRGVIPLLTTPIHLPALKSVFGRFVHARRVALGAIFIVLLAGLGASYFVSKPQTFASSRNTAVSSAALFSVANDQQTLLKPKTNFSASEAVVFVMAYDASAKLPAKATSSLIATAYAADVAPVSSTITDSQTTVDAKVYYVRDNADLNQARTESAIVGVQVSPLVDHTYSFAVVPKQGNTFKPGKYRLAVDVIQNGNHKQITQDFTWGVLAMNANQSIYTPNQMAKLSFAVLDERGDMNCNAALFLRISHNGQVDELSTANGKIVRNPECLVYGINTRPDFEATYKLGDSGDYQLTLLARTDKGPYTITDTIVVQDSVPLTVERIAATRLFPFNPLPVTLRITANQSFQGVIEETVPANFVITPLASTTAYATVRRVGDVQHIDWTVDMHANTVLTIGYQYKAPEVSPEFYLVGPLKFLTGSATGSLFFIEARSWQIASDAACAWLNDTTGTFATAGNWGSCSGSYPQSGDTAVFTSTHNGSVTLGADVNVAGLSFGSSYSGTFTQSGSYQVTVGTSNFVFGAGTFAGGSGAINIGSGGNAGSFTLSSGTFTNTSGTMHITASFTKSGAPTFSANGGTVAFDGTVVGSSSVDAAGITFNLVTISRSISSFADSPVLTVANGTTLPLGNTATLTLVNTYCTSSWCQYFLTNNGTITVGTGTFTSNVGAVLTNNGTISGSATTWNMNGDFVNNGTVTLASLATYSSSTYFNGTGAFTNNANKTFTAAAGPTFNIASSFLINNPNTGFPAANVNLNLNGTYQGNSTIDASSVTFNAPVGINRVFGSISVQIGMTIASGTTLPLGNAPTITVVNNGCMGVCQYDLTNNGTITVGTGTFTSNVSGFFTNAGTISGSATAWSHSGDFVNNGTVTLASLATFSSSAYFHGQGSFTNNASKTFTAAAGVTFNVADSFIITSPNTGFPTSNVTLNLNGSSSYNSTIDAPTVTFNTPVSINRSMSSFGTNALMTVASGTTLPLGNTPTLTLVNTYCANSNCSYGLTNNGTITVGTGTLTANVGGIFTNTGTLSGNVTTWAMNGDYVNNGTTTLSSLTTYTAAAYGYSFGHLTNNSGKTLTTAANPTFTIFGNLTINGASTFTTPISLILNGSGGTQTLDAANVTYNAWSKSAASALTLTQGFTTTDFTYSAGTISNPVGGMILNVAGNFSESSANNLGGANLTINFNGTGAQGFTKTNGTFASIFNVNKAGGTLTLNNALTVSGQTCTLQQGTLDINGQAFVCGSTFTVQATGTLRLVGSETPTAPTLSSGSTVSYKGDGDSAADNYNIQNWSYSNLSIDMTDASDTVVPGALGTITVAKDFSINSGGFTSPGTFNVAGNWTNNGTFNHNGGTVHLTGTDQTIVGSTTFNSLSKIATSPQTLVFPGNATKTQVILGTTTLKGNSTVNRLSLHSSAANTQWRFDPQSTRDFNYLNVKYSNNINVNVIDISGLDLTDEGHNTNWGFPMPGPVVGYWKLDEGSGQVVHDSAFNANSGTLGANSSVAADDPTWVTEDMCMSGKCLKFTAASSQYVNINSAITGVQTLSFWVRPTVWPAPLGALDGTAGTATLTTNGSGVIQVGAGFNSPTVYVNGKVSSQLALYQWQYVVVTTGTGMDSPNIVLGRVGAAYLNGFMDDVKVYNSAISATIVNLNYNNRSGASTNGGFALSRLANNYTALVDGLVGYWKMDDNVSGDNQTLVDASGAGNNGTTHYGANTTGMNCTGAGKYGGGCVFDGADDHADVTTYANISPGASNFTLAAWIKTSTAADIIDASNNSGGSFTSGYGLIIASGWACSGTDKLYFNFANGTNRETGLCSVTGVRDGAWHHVVVSVQRLKIMSIYIDGKLDASAPTTLTGNITLPHFKLANTMWENWWNGSQDDVRIYNRALTALEVQQLYTWAPGPVGWWKMDEGSGTSTADSSGKGSTGTITGATWLPAGKISNALNFSGTNTWVDEGNTTPLQMRSDFTISLWEKVANIDATYSRGMVSKFYNTVGNRGYRFGIGNGAGKLLFTISNDGTNAVQVASNSSIVAGAWTYVSAVYHASSGTVDFYVNGILDSTQSGLPTSVFNTAENFQIGTWDIGLNSHAFVGALDDIRIYNYALTQKQIESTQAADHPAVGTKMMAAYWKFDEGTGSTAHDSEAKGHDGSIVSATWTTAGQFGKALTFNGSSAYVNVPDAASLQPGAGASWTVSAWAKPANSDQTGPIVTKRQNSANYPQYSLMICGNSDCSAAGQFLVGSFTQANGTVDRIAVSTADVADGNWHYYAMVADQSTDKVRLFVDGKEVATTLTTHGTWPNITNADALRIGNDNSTHYFSGPIDEVKVYTYAITPDEVLLDFNHGSATVVGANTVDSSGNASRSDASLYCVPGDASSCNPPVAEWKFDEGTGSTATDTSGNAFNGAWQGSLGSQWKPGKIGGAGNFNGTNNYLTTNNGNSIKGLTQVTIEGWIYLTQLGVINPIFTEPINVDGSNRFQFMVNASNMLGIGGRAPDAGGYVTWASDSRALSANTWYHVAVVYDSVADVHHIYLNGVNYSQSTASVAFDNTTPNFVPRIGTDVAAANMFHGKIDDLRLYNYARTPAQIAWDYNRGLPVAWWKFDECQNATLHDSSGNNLSGTWSGAGGSQTSVGKCATNASTAWYSGRSGKYNGSLNFDGTDDVVTLGNPSGLDFTGPMTMSTWVKTSANAGRVIAKGSGTYMMSIGLGAGVNGKVPAVFFGSTQVYDNAVTVADGGWHHLVAIYTPSTSIAIYVDAIRKVYTTTSIPATLPSSAATTYIGGTDFPFTGQIDDVRLYNYSLTPTQVQILYNQNAVVNLK